MHRGHRRRPEWRDDPVISELVAPDACVLTMAAPFALAVIRAVRPGYDLRYLCFTARLDGSHGGRKGVQQNPRKGGALGSGLRRRDARGGVHSTAPWYKMGTRGSGGGVCVWRLFRSSCLLHAFAFPCSRSRPDPARIRADAHGLAPRGFAEWSRGPNLEPAETTWPDHR